MLRIIFAVAILLVSSFIFSGCKKDEDENPPPTPPDIHLELLLAEETPVGITAACTLRVSGMDLPDSVVLWAAGQTVHTYYVTQLPQQFYGPVFTTDTTAATPVAARVYLAGQVVAADSDNIFARAYSFVVSGPDSSLTGAATRFHIRLDPARLFRIIRVETRVQTVEVTCPPGGGLFETDVDVVYATAGPDSVRVRVLARSGGQAVLRHFVMVYEALSAELNVTASEGIWPLAAHLSVVISPSERVDSLRIRSGNGVLDTLIIAPSGLGEWDVLYGARGDYLAQAVVYGWDTTLVREQLVSANNAFHTASLIVDPSSGEEPLATTLRVEFTTPVDTLVHSVQVEYGNGDTLIVQPVSPIILPRTYGEGQYLARATVNARDTTIVLEQPISAGNVPILYSASLSVNPGEGDAPLSTIATLSVQASRPDTLAVTFNRGIGSDTTFSAMTPLAFSMPTTYDVGDFAVRANIQGRDSLIVLSDSVHSRNTPPQMNLPQRTAYEDSSMAQVNLDAVTFDRQTPDSLLLFELLSQNGPATASLENHLLNFALQPEASGPGSVALRVTDQHGAFTDRTLNYNVLPMTDLRISLADLETLEPLSNGIVNINGQDYLFGDTLHTQVTPGGIIPVRAVHTLDNNVQSFERTCDMNTSSDRDTTILVSTYGALQEQNISPFRYRTYIDEGRVALANIGGEWRLVMKKINFTNAHLGFENGGYTWWIGKTNPNNGLQWTDDEQILQENIILNEINTNIYQNHAWARPNSHRATPQDSSYFIEGYGTTRDGLIPSYKSPNMSFIGVYDRNFDGIIESVYIEIIQFLPQSAIVQENLSALAFPNEVGTVDSTLTPYETVLHAQSQRDTMSRADIKATNEAINLPDAEELDRVYHIR